MIECKVFLAIGYNHTDIDFLCSGEDVFESYISFRNFKNEEFSKMLEVILSKLSNNEIEDIISKFNITYFRPLRIYMDDIYYMLDIILEKGIIL